MVLWYVWYMVYGILVRVWYMVYGILVRMVYGIWYSGTCMAAQIGTICHLWLQMYNSLTMEPLDPMCFGCTRVSTVWHALQGGTIHVHGQLWTYNSNMYIVDQRNPKSMLWVDGNGAVLYGDGGRLGHGVGIERHRRGRIGTGWPAVQLAGCPAERRWVAQLSSLLVAQLRGGGLPSCAATRSSCCSY